MGSAGQHFPELLCEVRGTMEDGVDWCSVSLGTNTTNFRGVLYDYVSWTK